MAGWAFVILALLAVACAACAPFQDRLLYYPDSARVAPAQTGLKGVAEATLLTPDGETLIAWRADAAEPDGPVILYFHGNARNLARRSDFFAQFVGEGWGLAALSYRGYSGSSGSPSETDNVNDALRFYDSLIAEGIAPERLVVYGESLGSGVATQLAARRPIAGLILHAPYDAVEEIAAWRAPFLFPRRFLNDRYRSIDHIPRVTAPILWVHGDRDGVIPIRFGHRLFAAATAEKTAAVVAGAGHFDLYEPAVFRAHAKPFVERVTAPARDGAAMTPSFIDDAQPEADAAP